MPSCNITPYQWCVHSLLGLSEDLRGDSKILSPPLRSSLKPSLNKGPLLLYLYWLPSLLTACRAQSIQFRPPYKVRIVRTITKVFDALGCCHKQCSDCLKPGSGLQKSYVYWMKAHRARRFFFYFKKKIMSCSGFTHRFSRKNLEQLSKSQLASSANLSQDLIMAMYNL